MIALTPRQQEAAEWALRAAAAEQGFGLGPEYPCPYTEEELAAVADLIADADAVQVVA